MLVLPPVPQAEGHPSLRRGIRPASRSHRGVTPNAGFASLSPESFKEHSVPQSPFNVGPMPSRAEPIRRLLDHLRTRLPGGDPRSGRTGNSNGYGSGVSGLQHRADALLPRSSHSLWGNRFEASDRDLWPGDLERAILQPRGWSDQTLPREKDTQPHGSLVGKQTVSGGLHCDGCGSPGGARGGENGGDRRKP